MMSSSEFKFCPALRGSWTLAAQDLRTASEEAGHAVVAALMGLEIHEARIDHPDVDVPGIVCIAGFATEQVACDEDLDSAAYRRLLAVLAGPMSVGRWPTAKWPLDENELGDFRFAAALCRWLKFDAVGLFIAECQVRKLLQDPSVHRAIRAVGTELLEHGAIPGRRVHELVEQANVDESAVRRASTRVW